MSRQNNNISRQGNASTIDSMDGRTINKRASQSSLSGMSDRGVSRSSNIHLSKINALKVSINEHHDTIIKILLTCKETAEKRNQIESAFRYCKEAFHEVATILTCVLEEGSADRTEVIKSALRDVLSDMDVHKPSTRPEVPTYSSKSYESVAARDVSRVHISRDSSYEVPTTTSFVIVPDNNSTAKFTSSQATRDTVCKLLRPSDCALRVNKITNARDNGIRIEAFSPDLGKIRAHPDLRSAGFRIIENAKVNPGLIIHGVPSDMSPEEIKRELIAQNLNDENSEDLKIVYIY